MCLKKLTSLKRHRKGIAWRGNRKNQQIIACWKEETQLRNWYQTLSKLVENRLSYELQKTKNCVNRNKMRCFLSVGCLSCLICPNQTVFTFNECIAVYFHKRIVDFLWCCNQKKFHKKANTRNVPCVYCHFVRRIACKLLPYRTALISFFYPSKIDLFSSEKRRCKQKKKGSF